LLYQNPKPTNGDSTSEYCEVVLTLAKSGAGINEVKMEIEILLDERINPLLYGRQKYKPN